MCFGALGWNSVRKSRARERCVMPTRGTSTDHNDPSRRAANETRDEKWIFCSKCAAEPRLFLSLLDSRKGGQYRVFRCQCGEMIWDE
jgi:hypothetical protein